jgi:phosphoglycerate dehydrogenase-like enzyme
MRNDKPSLAFAYAASKYTQCFTPRLVRRLEDTANVLDFAPMETFADERAARLLAQTEILVTGWAAPPLTDDVLALCPNLRLVAHMGATIKSTLTDAFWSKSIRATTAVEAVALPVVEYTMAMVVLYAKNVLARADDYRHRGIFGNHGTNPLDKGLIGTTIGIVGASRVGLQVIERLRAFDVEVLVYDPLLSREHALALGAEKVDLDTLVSRSDIVSLHAPVLPETRHMIDRKRLGLMRDGATLINTGRGHLLDHEALHDELCKGRIHAVLDVTEPEPLPPDSPLWSAPNLLITPHIAGPAGSERQRMLAYVVEEIERFTANQSLRGEVLATAIHRIA